MWMTIAHANLRTEAGTKKKKRKMLAPIWLCWRCCCQFFFLFFLLLFLSSPEHIYFFSWLQPRPECSGLTRRTGWLTQAVFAYAVPCRGGAALPPLFSFFLGSSHYKFAGCAFEHRIHSSFSTMFGCCDATNAAAWVRVHRTLTLRMDFTRIASVRLQYGRYRFCRRTETSGVALKNTLCQTCAIKNRWMFVFVRCIRLACTVE